MDSEYKHNRKTTIAIAETGQMNIFLGFPLSLGLQDMLNTFVSHDLVVLNTVSNREKVAVIYKAFRNGFL
jgi:hypothetical protein